MARLNVNPNKMELTLLKKRLKTANRGHKLLSDKQSELVKAFIERVRENKRLREEVEQELAHVQKRFLWARAVMPSTVVAEALLLPLQKAEVEVETKNIMGVSIPEFTYLTEVITEGVTTALSYGMTETTSELDAVVEEMGVLIPKMIQLAQLEKTCQLMANEIERTRRRVNVLEYVMIPQMSDTVKYIAMKLDENERGSRVRLMKVKEIVERKGL